MKKNEDQVSDGLNQIFEIINAKGDTGEIKEILDNGAPANNTEAEHGD